MDVFSVVVILFLRALVLFFSVALFLSIIFNVRAGAKYREPLATRLHTLRLSKMLSALGINVTEYLYTVNSATIHEQMNNCSACTSINECDDNLSNSNIAINEIDFCNNESSLKGLVSSRHTAK